MKGWRLILSPPLDGAVNMAIDESLFMQRCAAPTLRFYSWSRPTLSLGYFQKVSEELIERCRERGVDIVRRPTGGRAVLHHNEITYSVTSSYKDFPSPSTLAGIYKALAHWQISSLDALGITAALGEREPKGKEYIYKDSCFLSATPYEINVGGKKICGSAQKRSGSSFLQHGSLLLDMDRDLYSYLTDESDDGVRAFTTLREEGYTGKAEDLVQIMAANFEELAGCRMELGRLTGLEEKDSIKLEHDYRIV